MLSYESKKGHLPPPAIYGRDGRPLLSWRVQLLLELEEEDLYSRFRLDEPWDSPHNRPLAEKTPHVYQTSRRKSSEDDGTTLYQVFTGAGTAFDSPEGVSSFNLNPETILVVEAGEGVPWTKPEDLPYAADRPLPPLGGLYKHNLRPFSDEYWKARNIFQVVFAAGDVERVSKTDETKLRRMIAGRIRERRTPPN